MQFPDKPDIDRLYVKFYLEKMTENKIIGGDNSKMMEFQRASEKQPQKNAFQIMKQNANLKRC